MSPVRARASTLLLSRSEVAGLATPRDYLAALERAFAALAAGRARPASVGHIAADAGGFHIKSAAMEGVVAVKINANFPANPQRHGLPTIQGCLVLADADDGRLLAVMDSIEITARRTAAATALAAKHLARADARTLALVGCGVQARCHLDALLALEPWSFSALRVFDTDAERMAELSRAGRAAGLAVTSAGSVADAMRDADVAVLATTSTAPLLHVDDLRPGLFIAAVGADNPAKSEVAPQAMARARVVPDVLAQALELGDLRHAIAAGAMTAADIHGELAAIVAGALPGRRSDAEVFVYDSTGTAIADVAAAAMLYAAALERGVGRTLALND